jgi:2-C-methyl-D-erythritol 4-phosphate cytidylyltransferase
MGAKMDKAFLSLGPHPVLAYSLRTFQECSSINSIVVVVRRDQQIAAKEMARMFGISKLYAIVAGGRLRQDSVLRGLNAVNPDTRIVTVHDAARPFTTPELITETIKQAKRTGAGVAAAPVTDTVKQVGRGTVVAATLDRSKIWAAQTPQSFKYDTLRRAFEALAEEKTTVTDEAAAVELLGEPVNLVPSTANNMKITTVEDLPIAAALLGIQ